MEDHGMSAITVGAFVKVTSGPAYLPGGENAIRGRVVEIINDGEAAIIKVASGGHWGFRVCDLTVIPRRITA
jgi:hypothetical protein